MTWMTMLPSLLAATIFLTARPEFIVVGLRVIVVRPSTSYSTGKTFFPAISRTAALRLPPVHWINSQPRRSYDSHPRIPASELLAVASRINITTRIFMTLPNVQDEPRPWPARLVLLGARGVTAMVVGSGALLGGLFIVIGARRREPESLSTVYGSSRRNRNEKADACRSAESSALASRSHRIQPTRQRQM